MDILKKFKKFKKFKFFFIEYLFKQLVIGLSITILGGIAIYKISEAKDKEIKSEKLVVEIIDIVNKMEHIINNEFMESIIESQSLKMQILNIKVKLLEGEKLDYNNEVQKIFEKSKKYMTSVFLLYPYKKKLDLNMDLLKIYNPELFNRIREPLSKIEWSLINLRKSNQNDLLNSVSNASKKIMSITLNKIVSDKDIDELSSEIAKFDTLDDKGVFMNDFQKNISVIKKEMFKFLLEEQNKSSFEKLIRTFI